MPTASNAGREKPSTRPYSPFLLARKFLSYYLNASNGKGHGVHSPFVYDFIKKVLNDRQPLQKESFIEQVRQKLLRDNRTISVQDFGAGSGLLQKNNIRKVSAMAASSLKPRKYAALLGRMVRHYGCNSILELGTSFGITTAYIACNTNGVVYTMEGAEEVAQIAAENFRELGLQNTEVIRGDFDGGLTGLLQRITSPDLVFVDGNHRLEPTLRYFEQMLPFCNEHTLIVFDDIHWSQEMEAAWSRIKDHTSVSLSIDLFFIGIAVLRKDIKVKQHFSIRY